MENNKVTISLTLPNIPEYVSVARLTLSGVANRMGFNIDDIEDLKVAISEACTNALKYGGGNDCSKYFVHYTIDEKNLIIDVCDDGKGIEFEKLKTPDLDNPKESGLGLYIIETLMDEVKIFKGDNNGTTIRMTKRLGE
ncbi:histidine kinase [Alkalibaculum sp. M08DMB]|uniref:Histidine kinase n=1 Tax=Alkalibaculum sporogenes TaxID=2655001 RepID=A0A6A7KAH8_9FIRM|nr:ATP-binding protein [Alkalibaculum sporogenes]MPW26197.1 histidine kinase [Alkalibaculum sporogenes]